MTREGCGGVGGGDGAGMGGEHEGGASGRWVGDFGRFCAVLCVARVRASGRSCVCVCARAKHTHTHVGDLGRFRGVWVGMCVYVGGGGLGKGVRNPRFRHVPARAPSSRPR